MELSKTRKDKSIMEEMVVEGNKRRAFLNEQIQSKDAKITKLELKLDGEKNARLRIEEELKEMNMKWMQSCSELGALKTEHNKCRENVEYYQEKFAEVQCELMDIIVKYEDLYKQYVVLNSCMTKSTKEEAVEAELAVKEEEIKILRTKLGKEREKVKHLDKKLALIENTQGSNRC